MALNGNNFCFELLKNVKVKKNQYIPHDMRSYGLLYWSDTSIHVSCGNSLSFN